MIQTFVMKEIRNCRINAVWSEEGGVFLYNLKCKEWALREEIQRVGRDMSIKSSSRTLLLPSIPWPHSSFSLPKVQPEVPMTGGRSQKRKTPPYMRENFGVVE
jgi:hypothetical protein